MEKYLTAKEAREIYQIKEIEYNKLCEQKAETLLPDIFQKIEDAANNKECSLNYTLNSWFGIVNFIKTKLFGLGYAVTTTSTGSSRSDINGQYICPITINILW